MVSDDRDRGALGRRFVGVELKPEYFAAAVKNLGELEAAVRRQMKLL